MMLNSDHSLDCSKVDYKKKVITWLKTLKSKKKSNSSDIYLEIKKNRPFQNWTEK